MIICIKGHKFPAFLTIIKCSDASLRPHLKINATPMATTATAAMGRR